MKSFNGARAADRSLRLAAIVSVVVGWTGFAQAQDLRKWTKEDYMNRLVGKTHQTWGVFKGTQFTWQGYWRPDGTAIGRAWGSGWKETGTGTWRLRGTVLCDKWTAPNWGGCFQYYDKGRRIVQHGISGPSAGNWNSVKILGDGNVKNFR